MFYGQKRTNAYSVKDFWTVSHQAVFSLILLLAPFPFLSAQAGNPNQSIFRMIQNSAKKEGATRSFQLFFGQPGSREAELSVDPFLSGLSDAEWVAIDDPDLKRLLMANSTLPRFRIHPVVDGDTEETSETGAESIRLKTEAQLIRAGYLAKRRSLKEGLGSLGIGASFSLGTYALFTAASAVAHQTFLFSPTSLLFPALVGAFAAGSYRKEIYDERRNRIRDALKLFEEAARSILERQIDLNLPLANQVNDVASRVFQLPRSINRKDIEFFGSQYLEAMAAYQGLFHQLTEPEFRPIREAMGKSLGPITDSLGLAYESALKNKRLPYASLLKLLAGENLKLLTHNDKPIPASLRAIFSYKELMASQNVAEGRKIVFQKQSEHFEAKTAGRFSLQLTDREATFHLPGYLFSQLASNPHAAFTSGRLFEFLGEPGIWMKVEAPGEPFYYHRFDELRGVPLKTKLGEHPVTLSVTPWKTGSAVTFHSETFGDSLAVETIRKQFGIRGHCGFEALLD